MKDYQAKYNADFERSFRDPKKAAARALRGVETRRMARVKVTLPKLKIQQDKCDT